jgi:hypothetical protein
MLSFQKIISLSPGKAREKLFSEKTSSHIVFIAWRSTLSGFSYMELRQAGAPGLKH